MASLADYLRQTGQYSQTPYQTSQTPQTSQYAGGSIVDYLQSVGKPYDFGYRSQLAQQYGMTNYTGTAEQNTALLNALRGGTTSATPYQPPAQAPVVQQPSNQIASQISSTQAQIADLQAQAEALKQYGLQDTEQLIKSGEGYIPTSAYREELTGFGGEEAPSLLRLYEEAYQKGGFDTKKAQIAELDKQINEAKAQVSQRTLDERGKPIPQWMLSGRVKMEVDAANSSINSLIDQRNAMASEVNSGIEEIMSKIGLYQSGITWELGGKGIQTGVQVIDGRNVLINTITGEVIKDLGAAPVSVSKETLPTSIKEWEYAGGEAGTGMTFAEWLRRKEGGKKDEEEEDKTLYKSQIVESVQKMKFSEIEDRLRKMYTEEQLIERARKDGFASMWLSKKAELENFLNSKKAADFLIEALTEQYKSSGYQVIDQ